VGDIVEVMFTIENIGGDAGLSYFDISCSNNVQAIDIQPHEYLHQYEIGDLIWNISGNQFNAVNKLYSFVYPNFESSSNSEYTVRFMVTEEGSQWLRIRLSLGDENNDFVRFPLSGHTDQQEIPVMQLDFSAFANQVPIVDSYSPIVDNVDLSNDNPVQMFQINAHDPDNDDLKTSWFIDDQYIVTSDIIQINYSEFPIGNYKLMAIVSDDHNGSTTRTWSVNIIHELATLSVTPIGRLVDPLDGTTSFSISNIGGGTFEWAATVISGNSWLSISSGDSGTNNGIIQVSYTQNQSNSPRTGVIRVIANGATGSPMDVVVNQSAGVPDIAVTPCPIEFGSAEIGSETNITVTIGNHGNLDLNLTSATITGADADQFNGFVSALTAITIAPSDEQTIELNFAPTSLGSKLATLCIQSNDPDQGTYCCDLIGDGIDQGLVVLDGDPSDWDSIADESLFTNYVDDQGDSLCGSDGDIKRIVTAVDDQFAYIMVETHGKPINADSVLEIDFDFKAGQHAIGSSGIDLHTNITRDSFTAWDDADLDGNDEVYPINGVEIAWGDVAEIKIPLTEIENTTYLYVLDVNIWDDNYPINDPPTGCDATHVKNSFGQDLSVDGFDKYTWAPHSSSLDIGVNQLTMEAWVNLSGETGNHWIISKQQIDGNRSYGFYINSNDRRVVPSIQADWFFEEALGDKILEYDTWYHVAVVYDGVNIRTYVDGELNGAIDLTGNLFHNTEILTIGGTYWNPTDTTNGSIDEVRVWDIARTQEEICASMRKELSGVESGLIGYWQFSTMEDLGVGGDGADDFADLSGNGNHVDMYVGAALPNIESISPLNALPGDEITIVGQNFGATQGDGNVIFTDNLPSASITSWSDTEIIAVVPEGAVTGCVSVATGADTSNCVTLVVDPLITLDAIQDATISQENGDINYGTPSAGILGSYLGVGNDSMMFAPGGIGTTKALVQFDLSSLPPNIEITAAKLVLRRSNASNTGPTFTLNLRDVTSSWLENSVTWNNMTGIGGVVASIVDDEFMNSEIEITTKVVDWYQGNSTNNGLLIEIANPATGVYFVFGSREKVNFEPKLIVLYRLGDTDNDGLPDDIENNYCTDYDDADTDNDGILDGDEDTNKDGVVDPEETDPCDADTDNDGLQDGTEIGLTAEDIGLDTDEGVFIPDEDPGSTTDPLDDDSDGDGLLDGAEDANHNGAVDNGETDPSVSNFVNGLIAHWMMDELSYDGAVDEVIDASGGGSHGTSYGGMTTVPLKSITAGNFDGIDDQIKIPSNDLIELGKKSFTISLWMKASEEQVWSRSHILEKDYSYQTSGLYRIVLLDGYIQFQVQGTITLTVVGETLVTDNTWHNIVCVRDTVEKKIRLFIDGVEDAPALNETTIQDTSSGYPLAIGGPSRPSPSQGDIYMYKGLLDDVRIYNRVLTISEISDHAVIDSDEDGLVEDIERASCTDPNDADTDDDGILDGVEDANQDGVFDNDETDPCDVDTDGDGLQDGTESGLTLDDIGPDTDPFVFIADKDPITTTDPNDEDSDDDMIPDGVEDINRNGRVDVWEPDPTQATIDVIPDLDDDGDVDGNDLAALASFFDSLTDQDKLAAFSAMLGFNGFPVDGDGDGILDDGDYSGVAGDNPCVGGNTLLCDDNCPDDANTDQADSNSDGLGDLCDGTVNDCTDTHISGYWGDPEWNNKHSAEDGDWNTAAYVNLANKQLYMNHPYSNGGDRYWHFKYSSSNSQHTNFQCYDYDSDLWINVWAQTTAISGNTVTEPIPVGCLSIGQPIQLRVHSASSAEYYEGYVLCEP
jgi:hypothetical protein